MSFISKKKYEEEENLEFLLTEFHVTSALWRLAEANLYKNLDIEKPVLDLGCGDGAFAKAVFDEPLDEGIDISEDDIEKAAALGLYKGLKIGSADALPYKDVAFKTVISNCVLEHIPNIDGTLSEISRVLEDGGRFLFTVPSVYFNEYLFYTNLFNKCGLKKISGIYLGILNKALKHFNLLSEDVWEEKLRKNGFEIEHKEYFIPPSAMKLIDLLNFTKLMIMFNLVVLGRRTGIIPRKFVIFAFKNRILREVHTQVELGGGLFFIAKKKVSR